MYDVIYRQDVINAIENTECELTPAAWDEITDAINEVLSVDVQPVRHGRWNKLDGSGLAACGCGYITDRYSVFNYCPHCGAVMDGEQNDIG